MPERPGATPGEQTCPVGPSSGRNRCADGLDAYRVARGVVVFDGNEPHILCAASDGPRCGFLDRGVEIARPFTDDLCAVTASRPAGGLALFEWRAGVAGGGVAEAGDLPAGVQHPIAPWTPGCCVPRGLRRPCHAPRYRPPWWPWRRVTALASRCGPPRHALPGGCGRSGQSRGVRRAAQRGWTRAQARGASRRIRGCGR